MKGDCTPIGFKHVGKTVFCGKANRSKKEQREPKAEKVIEDEAPNRDGNPSGRARIMDENALLRLQGAWETPQQEDECSVRMDDLEWDYKVGQLEGYRFQGAIFGVDGSCKDGTMGSGYCKLQGE